MIQEIKKLKASGNYLPLVFVALSVIISLAIKIHYFDYIFGDYVVFLSRWVDTIKDNGYLSALAEPFYNYTPLYMYVLTLIAKLDVYSLYGIKVVSILFEYVAAYYVGKIAFLITKKDIAFWLAIIIIPLIPSAILNSTFMSQCDSIYISFILGSVYYLLKKKQIGAMIFLGIAFSLKSQASFILPFYFVYMLRGHIKWYMFLIVPIIYFISVIPAWIVGRPLIELLTIYISQTDDSYILASYFPNVYLWTYHFLDSEKMPGIIFVALMVLVGGFVLSNKKYTFTLDAWISLLFLSVIICPFFLPSMHERYLYLGDLVGLLYICINRKNIMNWLMPLGILFISFFSCSQSLIALDWYYNSSEIGVEFLKPMLIFPWQGVAFLYLGIIAYVIFDLIKILKRDRNEEEYIG